MEHLVASFSFPPPPPRRLSHLQVRLPFFNPRFSPNASPLAPRFLHPDLLDPPKKTHTPFRPPPPTHFLALRILLTFPIPSPAFLDRLFLPPSLAGSCRDSLVLTLEILSLPPPPAVLETDG